MQNAYLAQIEMIRIHIPELDKHRNETTFRPLLAAKSELYDIGIEFVSNFKSADMIWIGQATYTNKQKSLAESVSDGLFALEKYKDYDYILFDGQDSGALIGSYEVFINSKAKRLLKNTLYELSTYSDLTVNGRPYWNNDNEFPAYNIPGTERFEDVLLSGMNWLSTLEYPMNKGILEKRTKDIDVFAMFQYPGRENWEYGVRTSDYYTQHRKNCIIELKGLPENIKVVTAESGKVSLEEYYSLMKRSKIVIAPFGYGEIAPRDLEATLAKAVLIKPDMTHVNTLPNVYGDPKNYLNCFWDFSDLNQLIISVLDDFPNQQEYYNKNMTLAYNIEYQRQYLAENMYNILSKIEGYGV